MKWLYFYISLVAIASGGISAYVSILILWNRSFDYIQSIFDNDISTTVYDFIVVGAGSSGLVLSHRLSKRHKVLLIEAGTDPTELQKVPGIAHLFLNHPDVDWGYESVPQQNAALGYENRKLPYPRGKSLGGSSNLNYMFYLRGNPQDYDNWANITEDETWKYENVLPYFKKSIVYNGKFSDNLHHYGKSTYGNLHVETMQHSSMGKEFMSAGKELFYDEIDFNADQRTGFGDFEVTTKHGSRWSVYRFVFDGIARNINLKISRFSQSTKVQIDNNGRAIGVHFVHHGKKKFARAAKEVVLSAGAIDSPKLLMLSGYGPRQHLQALGIPVKVANEHVGKNLMDHTAVKLFPITIDKPISLMPFRDYTFTELINYIRNGKGILTSPSGIGVQAFISSSYVKQLGIDWPDLQLYMFGLGQFQTIIEQLRQLDGYNETILRPLLEPVLEKDGIFIVFTLVRPKGRGEITLYDKNPFTPPKINPKFLENSHDMNVLIEGMKLSLQILNTTTFRKLGAEFHKNSFPECENHVWKSDAFFECHIRHFSFSLYHPAGTCSLGKVVDSKLRVKNVHGLRVADASIMPTIVNANTNGPCIMIGEKAADFIREYWASQYQVCVKSEPLFYRYSKDKCFYSKLT